MSSVINTPHVLSRRSFLRTTSGLAAAGLIAPSLPLTALAAAANRWRVAIRDVHLKTTGQPNCWAALKALGVSGVEVEVNPDFDCKYLYHPAKSYNLGTSDGLSALGDDLKANGVTLTALCMSNRLDERLEEELKWANGVLVAARQLKVPAIRIDVVPRKTPAAEFLPFAINACKQLCELAAKTGVRFGIENHGGTTNDPAFLEKLLAGVDSPALGVTLDVANLYWFGHPLDEVYRLCERLAPKTVHTHCKNIKYPEDKRNVRREMGWKYDTCSAPVYEGDIDFGKVAQILRQAGYRGDLCLENECVGRFPEAERAEVLRREAALLLKLAQG